MSRIRRNSYCPRHQGYSLTDWDKGLCCWEALSSIKDRYIYVQSNLAVFNGSSIYGPRGQFYMRKVISKQNPNWIVIFPISGRQMSGYLFTCSTEIINSFVNSEKTLNLVKVTRYVGKIDHCIYRGCLWMLVWNLAAVTLEYKEGHYLVASTMALAYVPHNELPLLSKIQIAQANHYENHYNIPKYKFVHIYHCVFYHIFSEAPNLRVLSFSLTIKMF